MKSAWILTLSLLLGCRQETADQTITLSSKVSLESSALESTLKEQDRKTIANRAPTTLHKIDRGQQLSLNDIKALSQAGIKDTVIISQIEVTGTVFHLTISDITELKNSGASQRVIDAMIQSG